MGQDKALLPWPAKNSEPIPLLAHISHVANTCTTRTYILTSWPERYAPLLDTSVVLLREQPQRAGPLMALSQGWAMIHAHEQQQDRDTPDWLMVLACDLPGLEAKTLQQWCESLRDIDQPAIAALPKRGHRWEPLCGFYHQRCLPSLHQAIQQNIQSFQNWLAHETVTALNVNDFNMLQNCNTPTQWQQFLNSKNARNP